MEAAALKRGTVLFVDDEHRVLTSMRAMFRREYEVLLANSGQEAIDLLRDHSVDVIVSDQRMPGMTGVEVLKAVKTLAPNAMRILLTGYADLKAIEASINEGEVFRYLTKPCPSGQLKEAIGLAAGIAAHAEPSQHAPEPVVSAEEELPVSRPPRPVVAPRIDAARPQPGRPLRRIRRRRADRKRRRASALRRTRVRTRRSRRSCVGRRRKRAATVPTCAAIKAAHPDIHDVDLLVLTRDAEMLKALDAALDGSHRLHHVQSLDAAVAALEAHPIGVMVTDTGVSEDQIGTLTTTLKRHVPELVTIVGEQPVRRAAADRSDQLRADLPVPAETVAWRPVSFVDRVCGDQTPRARRRPDDASSSRGPGARGGAREPHRKRIRTHPPVARSLPHTQRHGVR